ncbi:MAG: FAD binding domain-containing protein [Paracoccaceae bacterium]|nr:FAD binding domain-containing protein [Paracoccaceae bacterium]
MGYHRPQTLAEALDLVAKERMQVLAGGTDLFPATEAPALDGGVLDLSAIKALGGIAETDAGWRIGAMATWAEIAQTTLPPAFDGLRAAAREVGAVQIQNRATIGGNLCNASPAADGVPPLLTLEAEVELASRSGSRRVPVGEFLKGVRKTALKPGEIMVAIHVPRGATQGCASFAKLGARAYLVISIAMVALRLEIAGGVIRRAAVAVGACSPVAQRLRGFEQALEGARADKPDSWQRALADDISRRLSPIDDIRADAAYRNEAVQTLVSRLLYEVAR